MTDAPTTGIFQELALLLGQWVHSVKNSARKRSRKDDWRIRGMVALGIAFWIGIFLVSRRVLVHVQTEIPDFWQPIHFKLMSMALLTFFSVLLFSNVVTSLSTFFLSDDLDLLLASPVSLEAIFISKFFETILLSSWMVTIFGLPVLLAFGWTWSAGAKYYLWIPTAYIPFLLVPAALGTGLTMILVKVFPARRARDILAALSIIVLGVLFLLFRLLRPEQFIHADARVTLWENVMRFKGGDFLVSEWMTRTLMEVLMKRPLPGLTTTLLLLTGPSLVIIVGWLAMWIYREGWSKAQEGRRARISRSSVFGLIVETASRIFPDSMRAMMIKDVKVFFRDATQWSQLLLLSAIMFVYIFNFRVLPLNMLPVDQFRLANYISFVNLGLAAFVVSAVAVRFVFPSVSLEGYAWWVIRTSPLEIAPYLWSKYFVSFTPLIVIAETLLGVTNYLLGVDPVITIMGMWCIFAMTVGITGMGVGMGATHPRFHVENAAQISVSYGGVVYMLTAMAFIAASVVLLVTPTVAIFQAQAHNQPIGDFLWWSLAVAMAIVTIAGFAIAWFYMRSGIRNLERLEV